MYKEFDGLSDKQIGVLKNAFCGKYEELEPICRYLGFNDADIAEVIGWLAHGSEAKPILLVLIYEYMKEYEGARYSKSLYNYNKYRF